MIALIAKRELSMLFRSKAHRIAIIGVALLILAGGVIVKYLNSGDNTETAHPELYVGVETQMNDFSDAIPDATVENNLPTGSGEQWIKDQTLAAEEAAEEKDDDPEIVYLALGGTQDKPMIYTSEGALSLVTGSGASTAVTYALVTSTVEKIVDAPLDPSQQAALASSMYPTLVPVVTEKTTGFEANPVGFFTIMVVLIILITTIATGMGTISQGVVEEKSSRVVEIILSSVKPRKLLLGKLLGIGTFVLIQILIWLLSAAVALKIAQLETEINLSSILLWSLAWMIVGFFVFCSLIGGFSAMVSRQEDLAAVQSPVLILMFIPFYLGIYLVPYQPDSILTQVLSFIPGFSSFMMPMRQALNAVSTWEMVTALLLAVAFIPLLIALSGRIYENSVLRMGKRVSYREALARSEK